MKLWLAASDDQDGSFSVHLFNTKQEALDELDRTEEELEEGSFYDDGMVREVELHTDSNGKLLQPFYINIE